MAIKEENLDTETVLEIERDTIDNDSSIKVPLIRNNNNSEDTAAHHRHHHHFSHRDDDNDSLEDKIHTTQDHNDSSEEGVAVVVFGVEISHLSRKCQFFICALGVFVFSLFYGYLQELIAVTICNRQLGLFLAVVQFAGYTLLSYLVQIYSDMNQRRKIASILKENQANAASTAASLCLEVAADAATPTPRQKVVPWHYYIGISLLRALDLAMTNCAMKYINYPAKTLMKSSRIVFTMIFGVFIGNKRYRIVDYFVVVLMMCGLALFLHADSSPVAGASASSVVLHPMGVFMLTISLMCDGAISNYSEYIMNHYNIEQDEYIFRIYSISLIVMIFAAICNGDLQAGMAFLTQSGTYNPSDELSGQHNNWSVMNKIVVLVLFNSTGYISSSFQAAITKYFGALVMSITSTIRKATTVFLSFFLFDNVCTLQHSAGVAIFMTALLSSQSIGKLNKQQRRKNSGAASTASTTKTVTSPISSPPSTGDYFKLQQI